MLLQRLLEMHKFRLKLLTNLAMDGWMVAAAASAAVWPTSASSSSSAFPGKNLHTTQLNQASSRNIYDAESVELRGVGRCFGMLKWCSSVLYLYCADYAILFGGDFYLCCDGLVVFLFFKPR